ncbi:PAAR domain-containing protein [Tropicimonas sp. TH_r6]|uniref:PAAR domain-containing protein n=1 Tax=Tropicimonas sp. TH_r6 TaxID=3082085 RepID=UPI00295413CE|nr:PAAR domain-containing protein [Tropicimonas sp. TH_r6]MDV7144030.1 PAAR domain-containing protein [Tropicimonas sp. TH_r6]
MPPAARVGDNHVCPQVTPGGTPHVGGPIIGPGVPTVQIGGQPASVVGDSCTCAGPPDTITAGSGTVKIGGAGAVRLGDSTAHGGTVIGTGATVMIGG